MEFSVAGLALAAPVEVDLSHGARNTPAKPGKRKGRAASGNLSERAYRAIHQDIVQGQMPGGTVLSEATIAKRLGVSRTPVGEAIRQLVRDGLVVQVPRVGTVVRHLDRGQIVANYELREALESYGASLAAQRASAADVAQIDRYVELMGQVAQQLDASRDHVLDEPTLRRFLSVDMAFHLAVVASARSPMIADAISSSRAIAQIFTVRRHRHDATIVRRAFEFHARIAAAIATGDAGAAAQAMLEHIRLGKQQSIEAFDVEANRARTAAYVLRPEMQAHLGELQAELDGANGTSARGSVG